MSSKDGVYTPQEIVDQAITQDIEASGSDTTTKSYSTTQYTPVTEVDKKYPVKVIARELLSQTLDTISKKIRATYTFSKLGAIKAGEYVAGVSGEVALSPDGITAINKNGETTVSIDGTTGDAAFMGEIKGGSFSSSGDITVGGTAGYVVNDGTYNVLRLGYFSGGL